MKKMFCLLTAGALGLGACDRHKDYTTQPHEEFAATLLMPDVQLLDVRTAEEYAEGHIPGAVNVDVLREDFGHRADTLDTARAVAVYCRSGARSRTVAKQLAAKGYKVYELRGGILRWEGTLDR